MNSADRKVELCKAFLRDSNYEMSQVLQQKLLIFFPSSLGSWQDFAIGCFVLMVKPLMKAAKIRGE